jgi:hypothetical protein
MNDDEMVLSGNGRNSNADAAHFIPINSVNKLGNYEVPEKRNLAGGGETLRDDQGETLR